MIPLYNQEEFDNCKKSNKLPLKCEMCENIFFALKKDILCNISGYRTYILKYCSNECKNNHRKQIKNILIKCTNCGKEKNKRKNQYLKTKNHFCSRSCAATYNNTHKQTGTKISKLEIWLQEQLSIQYPNLEIHYNRKDAINSELDIYIPSLKLAFELNGIFHYEPIYGAEKLQQIQNNDDRKFQACLEKGIELVIVDVSWINYWKLEKGLKILNIINKILTQKVPCMEHK
jgi:hypothetical protein